MDYREQIKEVMRKYQGVDRHDLALAMILAKLDSLEIHVLRGRYTEGSDELREVYEKSRSEFSEFLEAELALVTGRD